MTSTFLFAGCKESKDQNPDQNQEEIVDNPNAPDNPSDPTNPDEPDDNNDDEGVEGKSTSFDFSISYKIYNFSGKYMDSSTADSGTFPGLFFDFSFRKNDGSADKIGNAGSIGHDGLSFKTGKNLTSSGGSDYTYVNNVSYLSLDQYKLNSSQKHYFVLSLKRNKDTWNNYMGLSESFMENAELQHGCRYNGAYYSIKSIQSFDKTLYVYGWDNDLYIYEDESSARTKCTQDIKGNLTINLYASYSFRYNTYGGGWDDCSYDWWSELYCSSSSHTNPSTMKEAPKRDGYIFKGWKCTATGEIVSVDQNPVDFIKNNIDSMSEGELTFNAVWEPVTVDITLDAGEGKWSDGTSQKHIYYKYEGSCAYNDSACTDSDVIIGRPTRTGYTFDPFKGFYPQNKINNATVGKSYLYYAYFAGSYENAMIDISLFTDIWENTTFVCDWTINQYKLILDANGGEFPSTSSSSVGRSSIDEGVVANATTQTITKDYGTEISNLPTPTKTGYTFGGWQRRQKISFAHNFDISNDGYTLTSSGVNNDTYFTVGISNDANKHIYTVTFNADVDDNAWRFYWNDYSTPHYTVRKGFNTFTFSWEGERSGFTWDDIDDGQRSKILKISNLTFELASSSVTSIVLEEDTTLMAEWDPITYKVTLDANGGKWSDGSTQKEVYFKYRENKYYSDSACTQEITSLELPTKPKADFDTSMGFYATEAKYGVNAGEHYCGRVGEVFVSDLCDDIWGNDVTLICQYIDWPTTTFNANYVPYDEMVGSVNINGGIASGFSNSNYLKIKSRDSYGVSYFAYSDWELQIKATKATKLTTENVNTGGHYFFHASGNKSWSLMIGAGHGDDFAVWYETTTMWNNGTGWSSYSFGAPSTKSEFTWLRLKYSGSVLTMLRSEDGKEFTTVRAISIDLPYIDPSSQYMTFGNAWGDCYYGDTKIDFGETYLKAGGKIVWGNEATRITVKNGDAYGALPTVTRDGYIFRNWAGNLATDASQIVTANNTDYRFVQYTLNKNFVPGNKYSIIAKIKCELTNTTSGYDRKFSVYLDYGWICVLEYFPSTDEWGYYRGTFTAPFTRKHSDGSFNYSKSKNTIDFYNIPDSIKQYKYFSVDGFAIFDGELGGEISGYSGYEKLLAGNSGYTCQATKDTTFYANWEKQKYSAYWDLNYDSGSSDPRNQESVSSNSRLKYNPTLSRSSVTISASDSNNYNFYTLGSLLPGYDYEITIGKYVFNTKSSTKTDDTYSIRAYDHDKTDDVVPVITAHANVENFTYKFYCPMTASRKSAGGTGTCLLIYAGNSGETAGNGVTITNITVKCEERMQFTYNPELSR